MPSFNKIGTIDYLISAKLINDGDERSTRRSFVYFSGTDLNFFINAKARSRDAYNVALKYKWRLLRFNGSEYCKTDKYGYDYLRGGYFSDKLILGDRLNIPFVTPSGEYKLQLRISRAHELITFPEWVDLVSVTLLDKERAKLKMWLALIGIAVAIVIGLLTWWLR